MRSNKNILYAATVLTSLLSLNLKAIASNHNNSSGPFDIPSKETVDEQRKLHNLRSDHQKHDGLIDELATFEQQQQQQQQHRQRQRQKEQIPRSREEQHEARKLRSERIKERREQAKKIIKEHQPDVGELERMPVEEIRKVYGNVVKSDPNLENKDNRWLRSLGERGLSSSSGSDLADSSVEYDSWAQAYRMLGGFIDCDNDQDGDGSGDNNNNGGGQNEGSCSRWMMWASYVNPNYAGGGRDEYFSDDDNSYQNNADEEYYQSATSLDCHTDQTDWQLLGVYREEFYQYIEQISKHLWAIDDYEYVVALAGLAYMTDDDCYGVGYDDSGNYLYAGVQPYSGGNFQMGLYVDQQCLIPDTTSGHTFDDFGLTSDMDLGSQDDGSLSDDALYSLYGYWQNAQEYTLTLLNEVYEEFKYCTLCVDYPTYQDGYFIGDSGTDDDDLINQCWKFHSHDSFTCESGCLALGDAQGSITRINYLGKGYGSYWDGANKESSSNSYSSGSSSSSSSSGSSSYGGGDTVSRFSRFKANAYLTFNGVLFIATFLAFSVARGNRDTVESSSDKRKSLLSKEERKNAARSSKSSKSATSRRSSKSSSNRTKKPSTGKSVASKTSRTSRKSSTSRAGSKSRGSSASRSKSRQRTSSRNSRSKRSGSYA